MAESDNLETRVWARRYTGSAPRTLDIPSKLLTEVIGESAERWADHTALIYYGAKWSYQSVVGGEWPVRCGARPRRDRSR